ncbi:MAG TPA: CpaF family protein [Frankiaceae bacterium]|nr:CpaF family protein [Frankiaceae bacterium]
MKLSDRLAELEKQAPAKEVPAQRRRAGAATEPTRRSARTAAPKEPASDWDSAKRTVRELVVADLGPRLAAVTDIDTEVGSVMESALARGVVKVTPADRKRFVAEVASDLLGYGPLDPLLADSSVDEIMCNGYDDIYVERRGRIERTDARFADESHFRQVIEKIVSAVGRRVDEGSPMVDARLPDGSRVNAVLPPLSIHGPVMTIRKFAERPYTATDLIANGTLTMDTAVFLEACVRAKLNVLISGGTGSGKTTTLNVVSGFIPEHERVITIEDAAELQLQQPHVVTLESRPPNAEGRGAVTIRDLVRNALRMRPDRIVVGEVRGAEALDMLQAMNTGHEGSLTTVHANSPRDVVSRLETMVLMAGFDLPVRAIREQIASAVDVIVHTERLADGARRVIAISEVQGTEGDVVTLQDLFAYEAGPPGQEGKGALRPTGLRPRKLDQLARGGVELPPRLFARPADAGLPARGRRG